MIKLGHIFGSYKYTFIRETFITQRNRRIYQHKIDKMMTKLWFIALLFILPLVISSSYMVLAQPYKIRKLGEQYKYRKSPSKYYFTTKIYQHYINGLLYSFLIFWNTLYFLYLYDIINISLFRRTNVARYQKATNKGAARQTDYTNCFIFSFVIALEIIHTIPIYKKNQKNIINEESVTTCLVDQAAVQSIDPNSHM